MPESSLSESHSAYDKEEREGSDEEESSLYQTPDDKIDLDVDEEEVSSESPLDGRDNHEIQV